MTVHPPEPNPIPNLHHAPAGPFLPPQLGDGFAPPSEPLGCADDLADGTAPAGCGHAGLAGEASPF